MKALKQEDLDRLSTLSPEMVLLIDQYAKAKTTAFDDDMAMYFRSREHAILSQIAIHRSNWVTEAGIEIDVRANMDVLRNQCPQGLNEFLLNEGVSPDEVYVREGSFSVTIYASLSQQLAVKELIDEQLPDLMYDLFMSDVKMLAIIPDTRTARHWLDLRGSQMIQMLNQVPVDDDGVLMSPFGDFEIGTPHHVVAGQIGQHFHMDHGYLQQMMA